MPPTVALFSLPLCTMSGKILSNVTNSGGRTWDPRLKGELRDASSNRLQFPWPCNQIHHVSIKVAYSKECRDSRMWKALYARVEMFTYECLTGDAGFRTLDFLQAKLYCPAMALSCYTKPSINHRSIAALLDFSASFTSPAI